MSVELRERKVSKGKISYYLDIYHDQIRSYETLYIYVNKKKPTEGDKEKMRLANEIRVQRENELIVETNGLVDKTKRKADFVGWFDAYMKERKLNNSHNKSTLKHLKDYLNGRNLPFNTITIEWLQKFTRHLLTLVSNNTAGDYLRNLFTALEDAVIAKIINQNPFRLIPRHERLKRKPILRDNFTLDELQVLADTPCGKMEPQYKQAFLFSCFCGLRWSDVNPLRWSEIIIKTINGKEEWFIYFEQEKSEGVEYLPLSDGAIDILMQRRAEQSENNEISQYVFPLVKEIDEKRATRYKQVWYRLKIWAKAAGIDPKRMHFHTARHSFATNILENSPDADLWTVSKLLGHKTINPTQIYTHVRDSRKVAAVKALPRLNLKQAAA